MDIKHIDNRKVSILLLGTQMAIGGAQKVLLDQARWFHEHGHKVTTVFFYDRDGFHKKWQDVSPFPVVNLNAFQKGKGRLQNGLSILKGLWRLWKLLCCEKFDVIETFTHDSNMLALPLAWMARIPVRIATHHGIIEGIPRWREKIHAWMINNNIAHHIVAVSAMTRQKLLEEGVKAERIIVIQNGIASTPLEGVNKLEVRKEAGMREDDLVMLAVGRLVYSKAHEILIAAMPAVLKEFPTAKVGICGDGVLRADLEAQIRSLGLSDSVRLLGESDHVAKFLASSDVFVLPSRWEGLPMALLEAMMAGLPIIATKVEGVEEVIVQGEHGLLVPIENPDALADAIIQLLADPQLRHKMGAAAKKQVLEWYTTDRMCEQYLALILKQVKPARLNFLQKR
jgi:glycosyltransferase involved in cell wall biosynthesis